MRRNSHATYGSVTQLFHWLMALLVIAMIPLGIITNGMQDVEPLKPTLFSLHKTLGVLIFFLALARIAWAFSQPKPGNLHPDRKAETFFAALVHWLLYASLVIVPLSGWVHHATTAGFAPIWWPFGQDLPFVPKSDTVAHIAAALHIIFERVLAVSILMHVLGALKHHFIDRDVTLRRMLPGHTGPEDILPPTRHISKAPLIAVVGVYALALAIGANLGLFATNDQLASPALERAQSEWVIKDGTIGLTIKQLGTEVQGGFQDWTAAIDFSEKPDDDGRHGNVEVTVSVPSLVLGSVAQQAMGSDFFDTETHPTATFKADIIAKDDNYIAQGILTIRDIEAPIQLPFTLQIEGHTARMAGHVLLDRTTFQIGSDTQPTEASLAFEVIVDVALTAIRN